MIKYNYFLILLLAFWMLSLAVIIVADRAGAPLASHACVETVMTVSVVSSLPTGMFLFVWVLIWMIQWQKICAVSSIIG
jgi:hypothetical protein